METLPNDVSGTILSSASRYGSSIQIADFCPFIQVRIYVLNNVWYV